MLKNTINMAQAIVAILLFPLAYLMASHFIPSLAFIFTLLAYWLMIIYSLIAMLLKDNDLAYQLKSRLLGMQRRPLALLAFIPVLGVFFVVFQHALPSLSPTHLIALALIALANGLLEELFWRGMTKNWAISLGGFTIIHFAFLLLPIHYHGGGLALVGGAFMMGVIWTFVTKVTGSILPAILAHILVNFFAFSGLFLDNKFF